MKTEENQRIFVTPEEAINLLPTGERIHTFVNIGFTILGADWKRETIIQEIEEVEKREIAGPHAQGINHGLVLLRKNKRLLFIETVKERIEEIETKFLNQQKS